MVAIHEPRPDLDRYCPDTGGDIRGKQSAAILVVAGDKDVPLWKGKIFDLRVEDSTDPIVELRRLLHVARTYRRMTEGDDLMTVGKVEEALVAYRDADAF